MLAATAALVVARLRWHWHTWRVARGAPAAVLASADEHAHRVMASAALERLSSVARLRRSEVAVRRAAGARKMAATLHGWRAWRSLAWRERVAADAAARGAKAVALRQLHAHMSAWVCRAAEGPIAASHYWLASSSATRLKRAVVDALRSSVVDAHSERRRAEDHDLARLLGRVRAGWIAPRRRARRLREAAAAVAVHEGAAVRRAAWRSWRRAFAIRRSATRALGARGRECAGTHLAAWAALAKALSGARRLQQRTDGRVASVHLDAWRALCVRRADTRTAGGTLASLRAGRTRAALLRCWARQAGAAAAGHALARASLENSVIGCWDALAEHARRARRERRWQARHAAAVEGALRVNPALGEVAHRCLARWRLLLLGRCVRAWAHAARGRVHRRVAALAVARSARLGVLRRCTCGWREVIWHDQLMRRVRTQLNAERAAAAAAAAAAVEGHQAPYGLIRCTTAHSATPAPRMRAGGEALTPVQLLPFSAVKASDFYSTARRETPRTV